MPDEDLKRILVHTAVSVFIFYQNKEPIGFAELDGREQANEVKLAYFGLRPSFRGQGLGSHCLQKVVQKAWSLNPQRLWLQTCELDHPAALPTYLRAGFRIFARRQEPHLLVD